MHNRWWLYPGYSPSGWGSPRRRSPDPLGRGQAMGCSGLRSWRALAAILYPEGRDFEAVPHAATSDDKRLGDRVVRVTGLGGLAGLVLVQETLQKA